MKKITLLLSLVALFLALPAMAKTGPMKNVECKGKLCSERDSQSDSDLDVPLVGGSSQAERKLLNGEGYNQQSALPDSDGEGQGNHRCKSDEDCEHDE